MQHTVVAIFDEFSEAEQARDDVIAAGLSADKVQLKQKDQDAADKPPMSSSDSSMTTRRDDDDSFGSGISNFFSSLFGDGDRNDAKLYSEAVRRGSYVLTVEVADDSQLEKITSAIERNSPIDIEDRVSQWQSGGWSGQGAMRNESSTSGTSSTSSMSGGMGAGSGSAALRGDMLQGSSSGSMQRSSSDPQQRSPSDAQQLSSSGAQQLDSSGTQQLSSSDAQQRIPVMEERLQVGKREVQRGGARVYQRVVDQPVHETVQLREEHVNIERRPVDQPATAADLAAMKEGSFEIRENAEEAVVQKNARVVEEVVVGKETTQRTQHIDDTLRKTQVDVQKMSGQNDDDEHFRMHFGSTYSQSGRSYDDYLPAYQYGSSLASDQRYQGQSWDDVETNARSDWERNNPNSGWNDFKAAVRRGWERVTD